MATVHDRLGGRLIELLIPFEFQGRKIEQIALKPICFDHMLRWQQGAFQSSLALLVALSGENEATLRMVRYPDADRVLAAMMEMLPDAIRTDITNGVIPKPLGPAIQGNGAEPPGYPAGRVLNPTGDADDDAHEPFTGLTEK